MGVGVSRQRPGGNWLPVGDDEKPDDFFLSERYREIHGRRAELHGNAHDCGASRLLAGSFAQSAARAELREDRLPYFGELLRGERGRCLWAHAVGYGCEFFGEKVACDLLAHLSRSFVRGCRCGSQEQASQNGGRHYHSRELCQGHSRIGDGFGVPLIGRWSLRRNRLPLCHASTAAGSSARYWRCRARRGRWIPIRRRAPCRAGPDRRKRSPWTAGIAVAPARRSAPR